jgi:hypothetical protein
MSRLTDEQLAEIRKRAEAATAGPWKYTDRDNVVYTANADYKYAVEVAEEIGHKFDGEFIAHAREDVPKLIAEVERLRRELSFIANVDLMKNAYNAEHIAVSVQSWALNVLDGVNHDGTKA